MGDPLDPDDDNDGFADAFDNSPTVVESPQSADSDGGKGKSHD